MLQTLIGHWALERHITAQASMAGTAQFTARLDGALHYAESGTLTLPSGTFPFTRCYIYRIRPDGLDIHFDDAGAGLFQSVDLIADGTSLVGSGHHLCAPDRYVSRYQFDLPQGFTVTHRVSGPRKSYISETHYRRREAA